MKLFCQFIHPVTSARSHTFSGEPNEISEMLFEARAKYHDDAKKGCEDSGETYSEEDSDHQFDQHVVLVLFEQPDSGEGFFSRRPPLSIPRFEIAISQMTNKEGVSDVD